MLVGVDNRVLLKDRSLGEVQKLRVMKWVNCPWINHDWYTVHDEISVILILFTYFSLFFHIEVLRMIDQIWSTNLSNPSSLVCYVYCFVLYLDLDKTSFNRSKFTIFLFSFSLPSLNPVKSPSTVPNNIDTISSVSFG